MREKEKSKKVYELIDRSHIKDIFYIENSIKINFITQGITSFYTEKLLKNNIFEVIEYSKIDGYIIIK